MNRTVFVDSSAWYALADSGDTYHLQATRCLRRLIGQRLLLLTTNQVVGETYTLLRGRLGQSSAQEFLKRTRQSIFTQRVFVQEPWEDAAEDLLQEYGDHDFSYVDATSFVAMRRLGLTEAFAFDHHFTIVGFTLVAQGG